MNTNNVKYLLNGTAVELFKTIEEGFLVQNIFEYNRGDEMEIMVDDNIYFVDKVFDLAPTSIQDQRIFTLDKKISELEAKRDLVYSQIVEVNKKEKEVLDKFKKIEQLKRLEDLIDKKITHLVYTDYGLEIYEFDHKENKSDDYQRGKESIKLITLFGNSDGDLSWGINSYKDGSGSYKTIYPANSYEEALQIVQTIIDKYDYEKEKYKIGMIVCAAKKYNLKISESLVSLEKELIITNYKHTMEECEKKALECKEKIAAINN